MSVISLLTGRGNNTLEDKNILPVLGKPLCQYPALAAKNAVGVTHCFVSSDDSKILKAAEEVGYESIIRPKEYATPSAKHIDVIFHALNWLKTNKKLEPEILVVLLANSATVKTEWIQQGIEMIKSDPTISSVVPAYQEQDHHPYRAKKLNQDGMLTPWFDFRDEDVSTNRQELEANYFLSHNFWVLNMKNSIYQEGGQKPWVFLGDKIAPIIVEGCFDVHTEEDLVRTEKWLESNL